MKLQDLVPLMLMGAIALLSSPAIGGSYVVEHESVVSFEAAAVPDDVHASKRSDISISEDRYIDGERSLKWAWSGGPASVTIKRPIPFIADAPELRRMPSGSTFAVWVYNPAPVDKKLRFTFGTGENDDCGFEFGLNYSGWRTCWVMFNRDMRGTPKEGMDTLTIKAPSGMGEGTLYIDGIVLAENVDYRHQYADYQVPFVKGRDVLTRSHWLPRMDLMEQWSALPASPSSESEREAVETLEQKCEASYMTGSRPSEAHIDSLTKTYQSYGLEQTPAGLRGKHLIFGHQDAVLPPEIREAARKQFIPFKDFQKHMLRTASAYRQLGDGAPRRKELRTQFVTMAQHLLDQGWAEGSCQGTVHHLGYSIRELGPAALLMRDVLEAEGLLEPISRAVLWYLNTPTILEPEGMKSDMDYYNTQTMGQLTSLLIMPDGDEKVAAVKLYSAGMSRVLAQETPGTSNGYKVDGTAFHHSGHYPGYSNPALGKVAEVINWLNGTPFALQTDAVLNYRRALLAARVYCNPEWSIGMCGRHPFATATITPDAFLTFALAGDPVTGEAVDREVLAAALRLKPSYAGHPEVTGLDIAAEPTPQGHWSFNYAAAGIHRHQEKMVTLKGYNKDVWSSEIYTKDNRFGRYQSHGSITILNNTGGVASGFNQDGWDWNRLPGTTVVHLPLDQLESPSNGTIMERSKEGFAGSSNLSGKYGAFAINLSDHRLPGSEGLRARKSAFSFEDRIICLGTGITSPNKDYPTETTLFQNALTSEADPFWCGSTTPVSGAVATQDANPDRGALVLADAYENGYYVPASQQIRIKRDTQASKHNKTKKPTRGLFGSAWIDHGPAPQGASYEYAIILDTDIASMLKFKERMEASPAYRVLRQDDRVHMVHDTATNTTGIACFEPSESIGHPVVQSVNHPSLVMLGQQAGGAMSISVCSPDLNLVENVSTPVKISVRLQGKWRKSDEDVSASQAGGETTLTFTCVDGLPVEVSLMKE